MLLRLLPAPELNKAAPPTILFTLPLTAAPYTAKNLPLPPQLLTHRNVCAREGIECSNALLGDKSAWISGTIDEVTFNVAQGLIQVLLIDGQSVSISIDSACQRMLAGVVTEVQLSFASNVTASPRIAAPATPRTPVVSPRSPTSSSIRSPSALLSALLSPIMSNVSSTPARVSPPTYNPARVHRRQARSLLVDAFRRHVLPRLKESMPSSYIVWSLQSEAAAKKEDWNHVRVEVDAILAKAGVSSSGLQPAFQLRSKGSRSPHYSSSASSSDYSSGSDSDCSSGPLTPASSTWEARSLSPTKASSMSPLAHLSTLPACSAVPIAHRSVYATAVSSLAGLASRLSAIQKLVVSIQKEESRKQWLESLEASRQLDKATRRAWSTLRCSPSVNLAQPVTSSPLWQSASSQASDARAYSHPAMQDADDECDTADCSDDEIFSSRVVVRPISPSGLFSNVPDLIPSSPTGSMSSQSSCSSPDSDYSPPSYAARSARRRSSQGISEPLFTTEKLPPRRPSLEKLDLSNYRIVPTTLVDSDGQDGLLGSLVSSAAVHTIAPKDGQVGFSVGVAIVR